MKLFFRIQYYLYDNVIQSRRLKRARRLIFSTYRSMRLASKSSLVFGLDVAEADC